MNRGSEYIPCYFCTRVQAKQDVLPDRFEVQCQTCGAYSIDQPAVVALESASAEDRYALAWLCQGSTISLEVNSTSLDECKQRGKSLEPHSPKQKMRLILQLIADKTTRFGERVPFKREFEWPKVRARGKEECGALLKELIDRKLVQADSINPNEIYTLTSTAWDYLAPYALFEPKTVFLAMNFTGTGHIYNALKVAAEAVGLRPIRIDKELVEGKVCDRVLLEIERAEYIVADSTSARPNVYFEAGYALALRKKVIWTCEQRRQKEDIHFDVRQYQHILWKDPDDLTKQLRTRLELLIKSTSQDIPLPSGN